MLCSSCSHEVRPVVAIDVDGTMGDYHGHFLQFAAGWLGQGLAPLFRGSMSMYQGEIPFSQYCMDLFDIDLSTYRVIKLAYRQGGMKRTMPTLPGAREICQAVNDLEAELWITTTRPYLALDNIVPDTVEWLDRNQIAFEGILFDEDKYAVLADRVDSGRVVAVLDDLPEMYDAAAEHFGPRVPILVQGRFNGGVMREVAFNLKSSLSIVRERIEEWNMQHA